MMTPSRKRAERCPSLDDLQGLNFLYPTCGLTRQSDPQCVKSNNSLGLVTFMSVVVFGVIFAYICVVFVSFCSGYMARRNEVAYEEGDQAGEEEEADEATDAAPSEAAEPAAPAKAVQYPAFEMDASFTNDVVEPASRAVDSGMHRI